MRQFESRDFVIFPLVPMLHNYSPTHHSVAVPYILKSAIAERQNTILQFQVEIGFHMKKTVL